jgi:hypothetical protein
LPSSPVVLIKVWVVDGNTNHAANAIPTISTNTSGALALFNFIVNS